MVSKLLNAAEVQVRYSISERTLWRWVSSGSFPAPITIGPSRKRWPIEDLDKYDRSLKHGA